MAQEFSIEQSGLEQLIPKIASLPDTAKKQIIDDVTEYSLGVLRGEQPKYKHVSRARAYGRQRGGMGWFSDKQRKYVMMMIRERKFNIPYRRTGKLASGWQAKKTLSSVTFVNTTAYAPYVIGMVAQSRHEKMVGWKKVTETLRKLSFLSAPFRKVCMTAVQKAIRKLKLG